MIKIGPIEIKNPIAVAPMAGISNAAFRTMVKQQGAGLVVCELSLIHISEPTRQDRPSRMPSSA